MQRYLTLLRLFWSSSIASELEYRLNFFFMAMTSLGNLVVSLVSLYLFMRTGYQFAGWTWEQALLVLGTMAILEGVSATLLQPNLRRIVQYVQRGTLDFILLKPVDAQFWVSTRTVSPGGLPDILLGLGVFSYAGWKLQLSPERWLMAAFPLIAAIIILYSLWFLIATTSIWFVQIYNAVEVLSGLLQAGRYPITAYPSAWRFFFTFVVPVFFLTTVPAEVVLGRTDLSFMGMTLLVALGLLGLARVFWRFALRFYTSASS